MSIQYGTRVYGKVKTSKTLAEIRFFLSFVKKYSFEHLPKTLNLRAMLMFTGVNITPRLGTSYCNSGQDLASRHWHLIVEARQLTAGH